MTKRFKGTTRLIFWLAIIKVAVIVPPAFAGQQQDAGNAKGDQATQSAPPAQSTTPPAQATPPQTQSTGTQDQATKDKDKKDDQKDQKNDPNNPKNDRIFMVVPNFATVEHQNGTIVSLHAKEKFKLAFEDSFDTYSVPLSGIVAAINQAKDDDSAWGQGWGAYGKRFAAGYGDTVIGSFMTSGVFPSILHEDPRYFRLGTGGFRKRSRYALKKIFVIRTDSGKTDFNYSEFAGNAAAAGISLTYHTVQDRNVSNFFGDYATQIAIDVFANQLKEFWPDIKQKLTKKKSN